MHTDRVMSMFSWSYWAKRTMLDHAAKILLSKTTELVDKPSEEKGNSHVEETSVIDNTKNNPTNKYDDGVESVE